MFLLKPSTIFIICTAIFSASCSSCSPAEDNKNTESFIAEEIKTGIPFSTKEPDTFQTDIIVTANGAERKYTVARDGKKRLTMFGRGTKSETSLLRTEDGRSFVINAANKTFTENTSGADDSSSDLNQYLTTEWLNQKTDAAFTKLETENNLTKYQVKLANSDETEILIYFDENLRIPVRQEFYTISNSQNTLTFTVELKDFQRQPDENLFTIPGDFKKNE